MRAAIVGACLLVLGLHPSGAAASSVPDAAICAEAARAAARLTGGPENIFLAIVQTESSGWPWTLNIDGKDARFRSREEAEQALLQAVKKGARVDVGCWQVAWQHHGKRFLSPAAALDPARNTAAASAFLVELWREFGSWGKATAAYHNRNPARGTAYACRVLRKIRQKAEC